MNPFRPLLVFGTRPEAIKMAPLVHECQRRGGLVAPIVCLTGQHREMLAQVTEYFGIVADVDLELMAPRQTLAELSAKCLVALDRVIEEREPDCVVAQGDTTSVMVAAMTAFYRRLPFVHVEAGLRTGDLDSPWPEEYNRRVAGLSAELHCAPTARAAANLLAEGVPTERVFVTGNSVLDALLHTRDRERRRDAHWQARHRYLEDRELVLITAHRRENHGSGLENICRALAALARRFSAVEFVFPVHLNPHVQEPVNRLLGDMSNIRLLEPLPYPEFVWLMDRCKLIVSDSGGVQEEAPSLGKPVVVVRDTTERVEALEVGAVELVGTSSERIESAVARLLVDKQAYREMQVAENPYGDGRTAGRIVDLMLEKLAIASTGAAA